MSVESNFLDDAELVALSLKGDQAAFGLLYDRYARLVRATAFAVASDWPEVEDLAQESFLRAYRQLGTLRESHRFSAWLTGIARQVAREHRRRRRLQSLDEALPRARDDDGPPGVDAVDETEHLLRLVARLPEPERLAVHAFFLNGRDAAETGRLLHLSRSGVYAVLQRACGKLAGWFGCREPECEVKP